MWFQVDMASQKTFSQIVLDNVSASTNYPRSYQVFVSNDGINWGTAVASGNGTAGMTTITFPTQTARYIRVELNAANAAWWFIAEFNVYP